MDITHMREANVGRMTVPLGFLRAGLFFPVMLLPHRCFAQMLIAPHFLCVLASPRDHVDVQFLKKVFRGSRLVMLGRANALRGAESLLFPCELVFLCLKATR